jgi:riboflavin kinase/FMN adenylyltransferase
VVRRGDGRGKELGFPTANILIAQDLAYKVLPRFGVYVTRCLLDRESFPSITNVGLKPTFETASVVNVESNIFDFNRDIYGHFLRVEFLKFMRAEKKFASREAPFSKSNLTLLPRETLRRGNL